MMKAETSIDWLTGPRARKLLRLYLAWPMRFEATPEVEGGQFYDWLKKNYGTMSVVRALHSKDDVETFLSFNPEVIEAAKFLKPSESSGDQEVRREERVRTSTHAFLGIYDCRSNPAMIGQSMKGSVFDVTPNGIGVELLEDIPGDAILSMTIAPAGYPIALYRITGEVRWKKREIGRHQIGIKMFDVEEAQRWKRDFDTRFRMAH